MTRPLPCALCFVAVLLAAGCGGQPPAAPTAAPAPAPPAPESPAPAPKEASPPGPDALPHTIGKATILPAPAGMDVADEYTRQFYAGELKSLYQKFSDEMRSVLPLDQFTERHAQFQQQFGKEIQVVHRESKIEGDYRAFVRWARFEQYDGVIGVQWILRSDDSIAGFFVRPAQPGQVPSPPAAQP